MANPVLHTRQESGEVGAAHAWHAMRPYLDERNDERPPGSVRRFCKVYARQVHRMPVPGKHRHGCGCEPAVTTLIPLRPWEAPRELISRAFRPLEQKGEMAAASASGTSMVVQA